MIKPHKVNIAIAAVLIAAGSFSYFSNPERPFTALIGPIIGVILLLLTPLIIKGNKVISHLIVILSFAFGVQTGIMAFQSLNHENEDARPRRIAVFSIMSAGCLIGTGFYIAGFVQRKKELKKAN